MLATNTQTWGLRYLALLVNGPVKYVDMPKRMVSTSQLLADKDRQVIKSYGVYHWLGLDAYNIARPATFVIDEDLIIRFMYIGSHQFDLPKHEDIVATLKSL